MKLQKLLIITIIAIGILIPKYHVFAQIEKNECGVCMTSAEEFDMILNMTNDLINYIKTTWKEWDYIWEYINPNRYEWAKFNPPSTKKKLSNIILKSESLITTVALLFSPTKLAWVEDFAFGFMIMFKNKVFPRDYKKILDIESRISDKIYELGLWWWYYEKINDINKKDIDKILSKYKSKWILLSYYLDNDITYKNIVDQANEITSSLKSFLATKETAQFNKFDWKITLNIDPNKINTMKSAYECSNECNATLKISSKNIKDLEERIKQWFKNDWKTISKSIKKLREEIDSIQTWNLFKNTLKIKWLTWLSEDLKKLWEWFKLNKINIQENETLKSWNGGNVETAELEDDLLRISMLSTIEKHKENLDYAVITETKNTNYFFKYLSDLINRNIETAKSFKTHLNNSANLQCSK